MKKVIGRARKIGIILLAVCLVVTSGCFSELTAGINRWFVAEAAVEEDDYQGQPGEGKEQDPSETGEGAENSSANDNTQYDGKLVVSEENKNSVSGAHRQTQSMV